MSWAPYFVKCTVVAFTDTISKQIKKCGHKLVHRKLLKKFEN